MVPGAVFENPDGSPIIFDADYFNRKREASSNLAGPFSCMNHGESEIKLWPK